MLLEDAPQQKTTNQLAEQLQREESGDKPYLVKSGKTIADRISELTGIPYRTIAEHLDNEFKQSKEKIADTANFGKGDPVRVSKPIVAELQGVVQEATRLVKENPELKEEVIRKIQGGLAVTRLELSDELEKKDW